MSTLSPFVAILPLMIAAGPRAVETEATLDGPAQFITIERPGRPPLVLLASEDVLARDALKGTWEVSYLEHEGRPRPDLAPDLRMRFTRGRLELVQQDRPPMIVAYHLGLDAHPPQFTWVLRHQHGIALQRGVYWLEGDTLMLCLSSVDRQRANDFITQPGDGRTLFVMERIASDGPPPSPDAPWSSLGVFRLIRPGHSEAGSMVRLAANRAGQVMGESYDLAAGGKQALVGSIDREESRIFWHAPDAAPVMETGLESFGREAAEVLVHHEDGRTEALAMTPVFAPFGGERSRDSAPQ